MTSATSLSDAETVREADRHEQLAVVLVAQLERLVLAVGGGVAAQVDRHVVDRAARRAHQLRLAGLELEVEGADRASLRARVVVLDELDVDARAPRTRCARNVSRKKPRESGNTAGSTRTSPSMPGVDAPEAHQSALRPQLLAVLALVVLAVLVRADRLPPPGVVAVPVDDGRSPSSNRISAVQPRSADLLRASE